MADDLTTTKTARSRAATTTAPKGNTEEYRAMKGKKVLTVRGEVFELREKLAAAVMLDLALTQDPSSTEFERLRTIRDFLNAAIEFADRDRWSRLLRDSDPVIELDELMKIVEAITEKYTGRPT